MVLAAKPARRQAKLKEGCHASSFGPVYAELPPPILLRCKALLVSNKPSGWTRYMCLP